jgi:hypothetical protein
VYRILKNVETLKRSYITSTADTVHVQVPVARIKKISKQLGCLRFYTPQLMSNSQLLVLYSQQRHITFSGNATNWNRSGYWEEIYVEPGKSRVKV